MNFIKRKYYQLFSKYLKNKPNSDISYIKAQYYLKNEKRLDLDNPTEFVEKLQWLNQNLYNEDYKDFVDKYEVRKYVEQKIGKGFLVDFIDVFDTVEAIDFDALPNQFALKGTHGSGYNVIVSDKSTINVNEVKCRLKKYMQSNYYNKYKERIYKKVKPRILAEHYLDQTDSENIIDYKFYCIHGDPKYILVRTLTSDGYKKCVYDLNWNKLENTKESKGFFCKDLPKPDNFEELVTIAKKLAEEFIFVRVDLYSISGKIYFGELTFFPTGALKRLSVEKLNKELGDLIQLPIKVGV
ncbi:glycosyltransferase [Winogradskyella undariae]|uniref:ATP-grasp fold amidoligase family protein n=1 Tax=Winogradskyella TaxID=286104 RepID=UPI00156B70D4|nr:MULTISPECIES: ATP-grasp fold amidoligase family protein [Winogradskyella]NRR91854.1 glycosyltransferase [Winogradskyella undariae]QXP78062.1 glycosyltransferase [Winogradskyella sp. HaHa_3_26]